MKQGFLFLLPVLLSFSGVAQTAPTWSDDIACLVYTHCTGCHNSEGIAPFSLMTYNDAASAAAGMQYAVNNGDMPPWPPDRSYRSFAHERYLTNEEIALINEWVNAGAPEGNSANAPAMPVYNDAAVITDPDLVVQIPEYTVMSAADDYRCFVIPTSFSVPKFITGLEVIPGNRNIVHHVLVYQDQSSTPANLDAADPGPGYTNFGGAGSNTAKLIGIWVPGQGVFNTVNGTGIKFPANSNIVLQVHYPAGTQGQVDSTKALIKFSDEAGLREINFISQLNHVTTLTDGPLSIPANTVKTFHEEYTTLFPLAYLSVAPHMHLLARSIKVWGIMPNGHEIEFIDIPKWDFHWQGNYMFRSPIRVPAGTVLHAEAVYDNTIGNPNNPNNPPQLVTVGEATTDEMMIVTFSYMVYQDFDENIVIDNSYSIPHYNDCGYAVASVEEKKDDLFSLYPNPASHSILLSWSKGFAKDVYVVIADAMGKEVQEIKLPSAAAGGTASIDISNLSPGMYAAQVRSGEISGVKKFIVQ